MFGFFETPVTIKTRLTRADVIDRLTRNIPRASAWYSVLPGLGPAGRVDEHGCWFENRGFVRRVHRRLTLKFVDTPTGTDLVGKFDIAGVEQLPVAAGVVLGGIFFLTLLFHVVTAALRGNGSSPFGVLPLLFFIVLSVCSTFVSVWWGKGKDMQLVDEIEELLRGVSPAVRGVPVEGEVTIRPRREKF